MANAFAGAATIAAVADVFPAFPAEHPSCPMPTGQPVCVPEVSSDAETLASSRSPATHGPQCARATLAFADTTACTKHRRQPAPATAASGSFPVEDAFEKPPVAISAPPFSGAGSASAAIRICGVHRTRPARAASRISVSYRVAAAFIHHAPRGRCVGAISASRELARAGVFATPVACASVRAALPGSAADAVNWKSSSRASRAG